jgi:hypothetical protein
MTESEILYIAVELLADMGQVLNREYTLCG